MWRPKDTVNMKETLDGIGRMMIAALILVPFGIWKVAELLVTLASHMRWQG